MELLNSADFDRQLQLARSEAVRYLSYGNKSSGKVRSKLKSKNVSAEVMEALLPQLEEEGYIKDDALIEAAWYGRRAAKCEAVEAFCLRMQRLGINEASISRFKQLHPAEEADRASLEEFLAHKHAQVYALLKEGGSESGMGKDELARLVRSAQSHGYRLSLIASLLAESGVSLLG